MAEFTAGDVIVPVVPSAKGFISDLKKQLLPGAYDLGQAIGRDIQRGVKDALDGIYEPLQEQTKKQRQRAPKDGDEVGGAFAKGFKRQVEAAFKSLPKAEITADSSEAQKKVQELRAALETLSKKTVGVDIDAKTALEELTKLQAELSALNEDASVDVKADTAAALAQLAKVQADVDKLSVEKAEIPVRVKPEGEPAAEGTRAGGAYAQGFRARVEAAFKALPDLVIDANSSPAAAKIAELRARMESLAGKTVGIDINASAAQAELAAIQAELSSLDGRNISADAQVDVAAALSQLAAVEAGLSQVDGRVANARVDVDVAGALTGIATVTAALAAIPAVATAALGAGALGGVFAAAGAGLAGVAAVAAPSLGRINEALKEQQQSATGAASGLKQAATETRNLAVEAAQAQIKQLQAANAADQLRAAQDRVKQAAAGVVEAKNRLKAAVAAAGQAQQAAAERAGRAERGLADAQRNALKAQDALNKARQQAARDLKDLARQARANSLDQRDAALDVVDAEAELNKVRANKKSSAEDIERATIAYERAKLRVDELKASAEKLAEQQAKGVEGQDSVVAAKGAVEAANQQIIDQEAQVAQAQTEAGRAGEEAAKRVAEAKKAVEEAQKRVLDAERGVDQVKRQQKIAALQERIRKLQAADAAKRQKEQAKRAAAAAAAAAAASQAKSGQKTAKLSPAEAAAAQQIKAFQDAYVKFQQQLAPSVLPVITGGLDAVSKLFKPLTPLIQGSAKALVGLEKAASKALGGKFWTSFFADLSKQAPTAISGLGKSFGNIITGIAGIVKAFLPFTGTVVGGLQKITGAFATWGKNLAQSQGFKSFVSFAKTNIGPLVVLFQSVGRAIGNIISALAPFGQTALAGLTGLASLISRLSPGMIRGIAVAIGAVVIAVKTWAIAQAILNVALSDNPIGLIITAIGLVVAAVVAAYAAFPEFKAVVDAAIQGITMVISWAWENVIKPAFEALKTFVMTVVAPAVTWLWQNVVVPAWQGISAIVTWAWTTVIQPALKALWSFIKTVLAPAVAWLWENVVKPAFTKIGEWIKTAWTTVIQPALKALWAFVTETLAPKVLWLFENVVKPTFAKIGEVVKVAWETVIKPALTALWKFITDDVPNGFKKGVSLIEGFWNGLKEVAKKPINFIISTVYNNGIVRVWNAVADALGLKDAKLGTIPALATGGIYPGYTPGRDIGLAAVSGGEAIMRPEWTRAVGERYVHGANAAARSGGVGGVARFLGVAGDPGFAGAFADGGIVGNIKDILAGGLRIGAEKLLNPLLDGASAAMGDSPWARMLVGVPKKLIADVIKVVGGKEEKVGGPKAAKMIAYERAQLGKPYRWGGTGPDSFDCSGLVMRALQAAGVSGVPRVSQDQMKWVKPVTSPSPGDLGFPHPGHVWTYSGGGKIIEAPYTGARVREVAARPAQLIGRPQYDNGGYLMPGTSLVHNGTGRPEPVLTNQQWQDISRQTSGGDGSLVSIGEMHVTPEQSPYAIAEDLRFIMGRGLRSRG
ncbi:NlpC/P60 family protein [Streptosporangium sp. NPDC051023]|uniref:NlpC/P60 family protein n=1 Tax=Streptosporangium sp. NPDC051023 TaxID=3155410 RepID=UPI00344EFC7B